MLSRFSFGKHAAGKCCPDDRKEFNAAIFTNILYSPVFFKFSCHKTRTDGNTGQKSCKAIGLLNVLSRQSCLRTRPELQTGKEVDGNKILSSSTITFCVSGAGTKERARKKINVEGAWVNSAAPFFGKNRRNPLFGEQKKTYVSQ